MAWRENTLLSKENLMTIKSLVSPKITLIQEKKVIKEHHVKEKTEKQRSVKQNKDKWVDEYDVGDTETRDVGVQMTTHYKLPDPPKTKTRNVGIQTKFKPEEKVIIKEVKVKVKPEPPPLPPPVIPEPEPEPAPKPRYIFVKKPKMKSQYVRVGGGWMKIDHYRNHHIPLQIFEHERRAKDAKKYLSIKYRYTKDRKKTPIAWSKYRSTIAKDS
ncbi:hypothetical protein FSP39_004025 [Pinctada imbricata]|uniref:GAR domain-containing protein n=1 Tax=Pinctada imbricata TaxID=66713 RepID=A0AA88Y340_PINIB|nr:hypothetical protein FSP39_004025 [Pinctada imbricata]